MAEFPTHAAQEESESHAGLYIKVWVALLILTVIEYFYAQWLAGAMLTLVLGLLVVAAIKAGLVGNYFMHVKWEGRWVYAIIIPACILAAVLICGLLPDIANSPTKNAPEEPEEAVLESTCRERRAFPAVATGVTRNSDHVGLI